MLLLVLSSLLLFFITFALGKSTIALVAKWLQLPLTTDFLGVFFSGLVTSYIYFNIVSFFVPVDYKTLAPLLLYCILYFSKKRNRANLAYSFVEVLSVTLKKGNAFVAFSFLALLILFSIMPPGNKDSGAYHYVAIRWYENFRLVPGLGNVHGRLAFNPASFIISAAYSFTNIVGQPLYPLNPVIAFLYYAWLLQLIFKSEEATTKTILIVYAIMELRDLLINMSSPSSDMLMIVLISYCGISTYRLVKGTSKNTYSVWILIVLSAFTVCAKLSAIPTLLLIPLLWYHAKWKLNYNLLIKTIVALAVLWVPWLIRNVVMSGYFLYPINGTNLISFDWSVPNEVLQLDAFFAKYGSRGNFKVEEVAAMNLSQLIIGWAKYSLHHNLLPFSIVVIALILGPFTILFLWIKNKPISKQLILLCSIYYVAAVIWVIKVPEYRFGLCLLYLLIIFISLEFNSCYHIAIPFQNILQSILLLFFVIHYSKDSFLRFINSSFNVKNNWLMPAKDERYLVDSQNAKSFPYKLLQNNIKMYTEDSSHECMNACLPCMSWRYGEIEMRGKTLQQGFRNVKNEVRKNYPWLPR